MDALLLKAVARGREVQEKRETERRRVLLVLILRHLTDHGYVEAAERLSSESQIHLSRYDAADNISLLHILQDYDDLQEQKYGKRPKLIKQLTAEVAIGAGATRQVSRQASQQQHFVGTPCSAACPASPISGQLAAHLRREKATVTAAAASNVPSLPGLAAGAPKLPALSRSVSHTERSQCCASSTNHEHGQQQTASAGTCSESSTSNSSSRGSSRQASAGSSAGPALEISGQAAVAGKGPKQAGGHGSAACGSSEDSDAWEARLLKPLPTTLLGELRQLGAAISQDIYQESPNVQWSDIAGLTTAKRLLQESVGLPMRYPQLFTGLLAPWRGVLLYGPPGTGKTLLAKAVATSCRTTFFNISASSIVSKWRGDSEKLVRVLFDLARHHAPATIFLDEVDALMGARGAEGEHEASRRMKTELLIQMDGLTRSTASSSSSCGGSSTPCCAGQQQQQQQQQEPQVFVLATSNLPWDLDQALLRRLQKRILVPLPDAAARHSMLAGLLAGRLGPGVQLEPLVAATEGYSGSDITLLAKEAAMRPLRRFLAVLEPGIYDGCASTAAGAAAPGPADFGKAEAEGGHAAAAAAATHGPLLELGPVTADDLTAALSVTKPSAQGFEKQYAEFSTKFGQTG